MKRVLSAVLLAAVATVGFAGQAQALGYKGRTYTTHVHTSTAFTLPPLCDGRPCQNHGPVVK